MLQCSCRRQTETLLLSIPSCSLPQQPPSEKVQIQEAALRHPQTMLSTVLTFLFINLFISWALSQVLDPIQTEKAETPDSSAQEVWTVYDRSNFGESELCRVLNCRKRDYCLVKGEDAICLGRKKLREAPGRKVFFRRSDTIDDEFSESGRGRHQQVVTKQRHRSQAPRPVDNEAPIRTPATVPNKNAVEWDPDRVRQKLAAYYRSQKRKERNRAAMARPNNYDLPNTFKENEVGNNAGQRPAIGGEQKKKRCTQDQLLDIGVRLPQWFRDMQAHHEPVPSSTWRRRNLHVACRREALWMFSQLDHDGGETLDTDELYALTYDQYEPCVKPFLDRCDRNLDNRLSLQEWCVCFQ